MDDNIIEDFGIGSYVHKQLRSAKQAASTAGRGVELYSNTIYEFRLDRDEMRVQDLDVLYLGEHVRPLSMDGRPITVKHIRREAAETRGVLYRLKTPVNPRNLLDAAKRYDSSVVLFEPRDDDQAVKLQIAGDHALDPGETYALYVTYTVPIPSPEPRLFYVGSVQPQDFRDIRARMGVTKATKRIELQLWSKAHSFEATYFDGTAPDLRPATARVRRRDRIYLSERTFTFEISPAWDRSRYFAVFAHWEPPAEPDASSAGS